MAAIFGDGYDCYAAPADATAGYWDSGTVGFTLVAGRFAGSQAIQNSANSAWLVKTTTGTTDNNHHISCAFQQTAAISGTTLGMYFQLSDGATNQVCIVFRSDGAILLTSATPGGTVLATYTGAITAASTWYQFEFEVVIHNTAGSFAVRKLGNTSNDFSASSLNTRPGANAQASKLTVGQNATVTSHIMDDLLWRSDTSSVAWASDIRCFTRRPASDASVQWTPSGSVVPHAPFLSTTQISITANQGWYLPFTPLASGTVGTAVISIFAAYTGNLKCAVYTSAGGLPTTAIGTATPVATPGLGTVTFTFSSPPSVTAGTPYILAVVGDTSNTFYNSNNTSAVAALRNGDTYASFPSTNPTVTTGQFPIWFRVNVTPTTLANYQFVSEPQQDAATGYVYSSTVGQSDLYGISAISSTPASIVAVTTRGYLQKSDAGTRNTSVQLKSGSTTVQSASAALNTVFNWQYRTDTVDPATGSAWTATGVNNAQIGVVVTA